MRISTAAAGIFIALTIGSAGRSPSATIRVDGQIADPSPGVCDLVEAIENANLGASLWPDCEAGNPGVDIIELEVDVELQVVNNTSRGSTGLPPVTSEIEIEGNGFAITRAPSATDFRILHVAAAGALTLRDTTVANGRLTDGNLSGGGILNGGTLTLLRSRVSGNFVGSTAGELHAQGGGIANEGLLSLSSSQVLGNTVDAWCNALGGGIFNSGTLAMDGTEVSRNSALPHDSECVGSGGGIHDAGGVVTIVGSVISDNERRINCGFDACAGPFISGAGISGSSTRQLDVINSTVSGNRSTGDSPSVGIGASFVFGGLFTISNSTIADHPIGIWKSGCIYTPEFIACLLARNLLANDTNCAGGEGGNAFPTIFDLGGNLATDDSCGLPANLVGLDPVLADNGGPTKTHALLLGSNAVDHAGDCGLTEDQRGNPRDDGACDAGAFELSCFAPDGAYVLLEMDAVGAGVYEACWQIKAQNDYAVVPVPGGLLTLRSGREVVLGNGFRVEAGGSLAIEIDPELQMPPRPKIVFVTSTTFLGNILGPGGDGLVGADAACDALASAAGRSGSYKAWLSDTSCTVAEPCRGFTQAAVPYIRPDGVRVADDWADLVDGSMQAAISVDELGGSQSGVVFTGTAPDGGLHSAGTTCGNWTSASSPPASGGAGSATRVHAGWTDLQTAFCSAPGRLYCFEQ